MTPESAPMNSAVIDRLREAVGRLRAARPGGSGSGEEAALIPQPTKPPISAATTRSALSGARRRRPSSSMNAVPTSGIAISAATPAAPPASGGGPEQAGATSGRDRRGRRRPPRRDTRPAPRSPSPPPERDGGEDRERANRRQAPGEALLLAGAVHDVAADVGADGVGRKRPPGMRRAAAAPDARSCRTRAAPAWRPPARAAAPRRVPEALAGDEVHPRLEHQRHADDEEPADQVRPATRRGRRCRCATSA